MFRAPTSGGGDSIKETLLECNLYRTRSGVCAGKSSERKAADDTGHRMPSMLGWNCVTVWLGRALRYSERMRRMWPNELAVPFFPNHSANILLWMACEAEGGQELSAPTATAVVDDFSTQLNYRLLNFNYVPPPMPPALPRSGSIEKLWEICIECGGVLPILYQNIPFHPPLEPVGGGRNCKRVAGGSEVACLVWRGILGVLRMLLRRACRAGGRSKYDRNCSWNVYSAHRPRAHGNCNWTSQPACPER